MCMNHEQKAIILSFTMPNINVRPLAPDDKEVLSELLFALADYEKLDRPTPDALDRIFHDALTEPARINIFLGESDGKPVGYLIVLETYSSFLAKPTLYIEDVFVLEEYRSIGLGSMLFEKARQEAKLRGCGRLEWQVLTWNQLAIDFYERKGAARMTDWATYRMTADQL